MKFIAATKVSVIDGLGILAHRRFFLINDLYTSLNSANKFVGYFVFNIKISTVNHILFAS